MLDKIKELIREKDICVLATVSKDKPYCSLMAYAVDSECREFYMVTSRKTQKYRNLSENPSVSLLIDSREKFTGTQRNQANALTVSGLVEEIRDDQKSKEIGRLLLERHHHLKELFQRDDAAVLRVRADSFLFLKGLREAHFEKL